jgi:hypothetical protein
MAKKRRKKFFDNRCHPVPGLRIYRCKADDGLAEAKKKAHRAGGTKP